MDILATICHLHRKLIVDGGQRVAERLVAFPSQSSIAMGFRIRARGSTVRCSLCPIPIRFRFSHSSSLVCEDNASGEPTDASVLVSLTCCGKSHRSTRVSKTPWNDLQVPTYGTPLARHRSIAAALPLQTRACHVVSRSSFDVGRWQTTTHR